MNKIKKIIKNTVMNTKAISLLLVFAALVSVLAALALPQILRVIVDSYLMAGIPKGMVNIALLYFAFIVFGGVGDIIKELCLIVLGQKITQNVRIDMMEKLCRLPYSYFSSHDAGKTASLFNNDADAISQLFTDGIMSMAVDMIKIIGILFSVLFFSKTLFVILLCFTPLILLITGFFKNNVLKAQLENKG
ncbi:MAG: ABC transporter transmembrane domain-containing protein, partial [Oscillospiraceae bacterium]